MAAHCFATGRNRTLDFQSDVLSNSTYCYFFRKLAERPQIAHPCCTSFIDKEQKSQKSSDLAKKLTPLVTSCLLILNQMLFLLCYNIFQIMWVQLALPTTSKLLTSFPVQPSLLPYITSPNVLNYMCFFQIFHALFF